MQRRQRRSGVERDRLGLELVAELRDEMLGLAGRLTGRDEDLAEAHVLALDYLRDGGESVTLNCGYGQGCSVREVLSAVGAVSGRAVQTVDRPRRPGDLPRMVADPSRLRRLLNWTPRHADLATIVRSTLEWERGLQPPALRPLTQA